MSHSRDLFYNQNNRLIRVEEDSVALGEYIYNGLGQRIWKTVSGVTTTIFHYDFDGNLIAESDESGNFIKEYIYLGQNRLSMIDVATGERYDYGNDRLGTPQIMTDSGNNVVWEGVYKPFGEADVNPNSSVVNNFRFPGQYYDEETGLHYNYHRYYDPKVGRYLRPDPIGLASNINLFDYTASNPINFTDHLGLETMPFPETTPGLPIILPPQAIHGTPENEELTKAMQLAGKEFAESSIQNIILLSIMAQAAFPTYKGKVTDYEAEKKKLKCNVSPEIKYGGPGKPLPPEPDDECERLANTMQSPRFKKLPWYIQALTILMYSVSCS